MKKAIHSSHLALRFYRRDGWTLESVENFLKSGKVEDTMVTNDDARDASYFRFVPGSRFDVQKMLDAASTVSRWYSHAPEETDLEYLESMNW